MAATARTPKISQAATNRLFYAPETLWRYETRTTHKWMSLTEYVRSGAAAFSRGGALKFARRVLTVAPPAGSLEGEAPLAVELAATQDWHQTLKCAAEKHYGVRCSHLETTDSSPRPLAECKIFEPRGLAPGAPPLIRMVNVDAGPWASAGASGTGPWSSGAGSSGDTPSWQAYKMRLKRRLLRKLPAMLAAHARAHASPTTSEGEAARQFAFSRKQLVPYVRTLVVAPSLVAPQQDESDAAWTGAELARANDALDAEPAALGAEVDAFASENALTDADINEISQNLAVECLAALGEPLRRAATTSCALDVAHVGAALSAHFDALSDEGLVLSADRCACSKNKAKAYTRGGARRASGRDEAERSSTARDLGLTGADLGDDMLGDDMLGADIDASDSLRFRKPSFMLSREEKAARADRDARRAKQKAKFAAEKRERSSARKEARRAFPSSESPASSADLTEDSSFEGDEFAMPELSSLGDDLAMPPLVRIASEAMPALEPISIEMPPLVPIASELPPLVPIGDSLAMPALEPIGYSLAMPPLVPIVPFETKAADKRVASAKPVTARNIAPLLRRFAALNADDDLIALAPTDDVFSAERAAAIAALANGPFSDAMARYVASAPRMKPTPERPVSLMTYGGQRYTLTAGNKIPELARPSVLGRSQIGKMTVLAHANDLA